MEGDFCGGGRRGRRRRGGGGGRSGTFTNSGGLPPTH